jgi:arabinose-5-phosphate isomerase
MLTDQKPNMTAAIQDQDVILAHGIEVVTLEASALVQLAQSLDASFTDAVRILLGINGRIIVTGMGKSGHIGRKIAATLSSTGAPAMFVHPAEAAHGDLGMLVPGDALFVLSNSGHTIELRSIMEHARSLGLPVIAAASQLDSLVMNLADVKLLLPAAREACPSNIAPTTSTVLMLALGDALAMAMSRIRGITRDTLQSLHPGGAIGLRLMRVAAVMHTGAGMPLVSQSASMRDVIDIMSTLGFGVAGVQDDEQRLIGIITDGDLRRHVETLMRSTAREVMTENPVTITADSFAEDALTLMNDYKITSLFVTEVGTTNRPIGMVHIHDFLRLGIATREG